MVIGGQSSVSPGLHLHQSRLGLCCHMAVFLSSRGHLFTRTPVTLDEEPTLLQYDLILMNHIYSKLVSK